MLENLTAQMSQPIIKNSDGSTMLSLGTIVAGVVGAVVLYFFIPERKRRNLFK